MNELMHICWLAHLKLLADEGLMCAANGVQLLPVDHHNHQRPRRVVMGAWIHLRGPGLREGKSAGSCGAQL
jgi:hypothetical protein